MPRTKLDPPKYPPINRLRAMILDRMYGNRITLQDLASMAHISYAHMRRLMATKDPWDWPRDVRRRICTGLDLHIDRGLCVEWEREGEW